MPAGVRVDICEGACVDACARTHARARVDMFANMGSGICADIWLNMCADMWERMCADVCKSMQKVSKCPYAHALMRPHMCTGGRRILRMPNWPVLQCGGRSPPNNSFIRPYTQKMLSYLACAFDSFSSSYLP